MEYMLYREMIFMVFNYSYFEGFFILFFNYFCWPRIETL